MEKLLLFAFVVFCSNTVFGMETDASAEDLKKQIAALQRQQELLKEQKLKSEGVIAEIVVGQLYMKKNQIVELK